MGSQCSYPYYIVHLFAAMQSCTLIEAAASAISNMIVKRRHLGTSQYVPGNSCAEIKSIRSEVTSGVYWTLNAIRMPELVFCQYLD